MLNSTVYNQAGEWIVTAVEGDFISVKNEYGEIWTRVPLSRFSSEPIPEKAIVPAPERKLTKTRERRPIWENPERRQKVLSRLLPNPASYVAAAWLLKNDVHIHLSVTPAVREEGNLENFVHSEITNIEDSDISVSSELTQGPSFTATVGGIRPPQNVLEAFKSVDVSASEYYKKGTTVQKWGFVYDFLMVELGVGFNHGTKVEDVVARIKGTEQRDAFLSEYYGADTNGGN
jgi:hypothetical protein